MGRSASLSAVATTGFARNHGRAQHPLGLVVGRVQAVHVQEAQQVLPVLAQAFGQAGIVGLGQLSPYVDQRVQSSFELSSLGCEVGWGGA